MSREEKRGNLQQSEGVPPPGSSKSSKRECLSLHGSALGLLRLRSANRRGAEERGGGLEYLEGEKWEVDEVWDSRDQEI